MLFAHAIYLHELVGIPSQSREEKVYPFQLDCTPFSLARIYKNKIKGLNKKQQKYQKGNGNNFITLIAYTLSIMHNLDN